MGWQTQTLRYFSSLSAEPETIGPARFLSQSCVNGEVGPEFFILNPSEDLISHNSFPSFVATILARDVDRSQVTPQPSAGLMDSKMTLCDGSLSTLFFRLYKKLL